jgi:hypothetical protein
MALQYSGYGHKRKNLTISGCTYGRTSVNPYLIAKYALSVLYGGLIGGRGAIFFAGLDNKL